MHRITLEGIAASLSAIDPVFLHTPQYECEPLSALLGCRVVLKVETLNPIRSFKGRGASYFVHGFAAEHPDTTLVAASAGNWGQALAYCCRDAGIPLRVHAATTASPLKVARMRALGADVRLSGADFDAAKLEARSTAGGGYFVEDGLEIRVTEGHGSIAIELLGTAQSPREALDAIVVPLGNGALLNGIARWAKSVAPATRMIGVCANGATAMRESWLLGRGAAPVTHARVHTIADGIGVRVPVPEAVDDMHGLVDEVLTVGDEQIIAAMRLALEHAGLVLEPAGAAGLAAIAAHDTQFRGQRVACLLCGGNLDTEDMRRWLTPW